MTDILDKVRKLLALSRSNNVHEAAAAAARAQALIDKHRLDTALLDESEEEQVQPCLDYPLYQTSGSLIQWKWDLAWELCEANACEPWSSHEPVDGKVVRLFYAVGFPSDAQTVQYLFQYLAREIDRLAQQAWSQHKQRSRKKKDGRVWKESFRLGAVEEIGVLLARQRRNQRRKFRRDAKQDDSGHALVRVENALTLIEERAALVRQVMEAEGLNHGPAKEADYINRQAFDAGRKVAKKLTLDTKGKRALE